jgi:hypothetical protein
MHPQKSGDNPPFDDAMTKSRRWQTHRHKLFGKIREKFQLKDTAIGAWGTNHNEYVFGACAIRWAMKVSQPVMRKASRTGRNNPPERFRMPILA